MTPTGHPLRLATAVYSAWRGYSWNRLPRGLDEARLDALYALAASERGEFPDPDAVTTGVVADREIAAAFSIRTAPSWDDQGRDSEYGAFAFFKCHEAEMIDVPTLLAHSFFRHPARETPDFLTIPAIPAATPPLNAPGLLLTHNRLDGLDAHSVGVLLAKYSIHSGNWRFILAGGALANARCAPWTINRRPPFDKERA